MSDIKRYDKIDQHPDDGGGASMEESPDGEWVKYEHYAFDMQLAQERENSEGNLAEMRLAEINQLKSRLDTEKRAAEAALVAFEQAENERIALLGRLEAYRSHSIDRGELGAACRLCKGAWSHMRGAEWHEDDCPNNARIAEKPTDYDAAAEEYFRVYGEAGKETMRKWFERSVVDLPITDEDRKWAADEIKRLDVEKRRDLFSELKEGLESIPVERHVHNYGDDGRRSCGEHALGDGPPACLHWVGEVTDDTVHAKCHKCGEQVLLLRL